MAILSTKSYILLCDNCSRCIMVSKVKSKKDFKKRLFDNGVKKHKGRYLCQSCLVKII